MVCEYYFHKAVFLKQDEIGNFPGRLKKLTCEKMENLNS